MSRNMLFYAKIMLEIILQIKLFYYHYYRLLSLSIIIIIIITYHYLFLLQDLVEM